MTRVLERKLEPHVAESLIRECLLLHPQGAELTVTGSCMEPAIPEGAKIGLYLPSRPLRVGDVVLLKTANGLRLHRILIRFRGWLRTKGDRGSYLDPPAAAGAVIGACRFPESRAQRLGRVVLSLARLLLRRSQGPEESTVEVG